MTQPHLPTLLLELCPLRQTNCLCDSVCDVNLLPVHFVNLCDVLPNKCKLSAAGGTP